MHVTVAQLKNNHFAWKENIIKVGRLLKTMLSRNDF